MVKVILSGCNGHMGRYVTEGIANRDNIEIAAGVDLNDSVPNTYPVYKSFADVTEKADVVIDFSHPSALAGVLGYCLSNNVALIECSTGLSEEQINTLEAASSSIPVFRSGNMSLGVNLIIELCKTAAKVLGESFDIEIIEAHHNQKLDSPSGTAYMIADAIKEELDSDTEYVYDRHSRSIKRPHNEIGIHSVRGGTIVGEHSVVFAGNDEIVTISHSARSKALFSSGAIDAALFIAGKAPGLYSMKDILK